MAKTLTPITVLGSTSNAAAGITRGTLDLGTEHQGGILFCKLTNGATGPTAQAEMRVLFGSSASSIAAAAAAGADWKTVYVFGGGIVASDVTEKPFSFGPGVRFIEVEVALNTVQAVTCEAVGFTYSFN